MAAGKMRERMKFQERSQSPDGYGNFENVWTDKFARAAEIIPLKGGEEVLAARLSGVQPVIIRIRYSTEASAIASHWKAVDARTDATYNITSIINIDQKKRYLDLMATRGVPI